MWMSAGNRFLDKSSDPPWDSGFGGILFHVCGTPLPAGGGDSGWEGCCLSIRPPGVEKNLVQNLYSVVETCRPSWLHAPSLLKIHQPYFANCRAFTALILPRCGMHCNVWVACRTRKHDRAPTAARSWIQSSSPQSFLTGPHTRTKHPLRSECPPKKNPHFFLMSQSLE